MKKIITAALTCLVLLGCSDSKNQEKALLDSVISMHDKMMGNDDQLMKNKMKLDTLLKTKLTGVADTSAAKAQLMGLNVQLINAEDMMEKWMEKFDPEQKGKSHEEIMNYLSAQKTQVIAIDSAMNAAIKQSNDYLLQIKK
jgi:hypothetical protein